MASNYLTCRGVKVHYQTEGQGDPLLLLHGWAASSKFWRPVAKELAKRYWVIAPDFPGFGLSDKPPGGYSIEDQAELVYEFLALLGVEKPFVVGHSMGGMVAIALASRYRWAVKRLVLANSPIEGANGLSFLIGAIRFLPLTPGVLLVRKSTWLTGLLVQNFTTTAQLDQELLNDARNLPTHSLFSSAISIKDSDLTGRLKEVRCPTLVIGGVEDRVVKSNQAVKTHDGIRGSRLVIMEGCGHCPMLDKPSEFSGVVGEFLGGEAGTAAGNGSNGRARKTAG